jgi:thymidylate synthase (FAD)
MKIELLDKGFVEFCGSFGTDLDICRAARVRPQAEWRSGGLEDAGQNDTKLLRHMLLNHHTTPFENVILRFQVKAPIFVFRQWHRHRTWTYDEISARYEELADEFYIPKLEQIGVQSTTNRQGRQILEDEELRMILPQRESEIAEYTERCELAFKSYRRLLNSGWPRELARGVLPLSTYSRMMGTVDLHNLMSFWRLRSDSHAQYEIKVYSDSMQVLVEPVVPVTMALMRSLNSMSS